MGMGKGNFITQDLQYLVNRILEAHIESPICLLKDKGLDITELKAFGLL